MKSKITDTQKAMLLRKVGIKDYKEITKIINMSRQDRNRYLYENYKDEILGYLKKQFEEIKNLLFSEEDN